MIVNVNVNEERYGRQSLNRRLSIAALGDHGCFTARRLAAEIVPRLKVAMARRMRSSAS
jgi:hypothetical protein